MYPATITRVVKKPEITRKTVKTPEIARKTVKKPPATKRTVKKAASLISPSVPHPSVHAVTASLGFPSVPRLSVEDVLEVFASVRNTRPPPPHLPFQVIPSGPHDFSISPPRYAFDGTTANIYCSVCFGSHILRDLTHWFAHCRPEDGLYILMKPPTRKTSSNKQLSIPSHLLDYVLRVSPSTRLCRWKTAGPRYSQPSLVQVRSCIPEVGGQRGDLWTMVRWPVMTI